MQRYCLTGYAMVILAYPDMEWPAFDSTLATSLCRASEPRLGSVINPPAATPRAAMRASYRMCPTACSQEEGNDIDGSFACPGLQTEEVEGLLHSQLPQLAGATRHQQGHQQNATFQLSHAVQGVACIRSRWKWGALCSWLNLTLGDIWVNLTAGLNSLEYSARQKVSMMNAIYLFPEQPVAMHCRPGDLPLQNGNTDPKVGEDPHTRPHGSSQKAHRKQRQTCEQTQESCVGHLTSSSQGHLQANCGAWCKPMICLNSSFTSPRLKRPFSNSQRHEGLLTAVHRQQFTDSSSPTAVH